jgi:hypothetical protein
MSSIPFGGFGKKKKQDDPPPAAAPGSTNVAVLVESSTQLTSFSQGPVDGGVFSPPAGYKMVEFKAMD